MIGLAVAGLLLLLAGVLIGEVTLSADQWRQAASAPGSGPWLVVWEVRLPRTACAMVVGGALGLSGALLQGLLRNPLADPGVLGVSASAALTAALAIVLGLTAIPGLVQLSALIGAAMAGLIVTLVAARRPEPEVLVLFGVALSSLAGAMTALIFNLSPSPIASAEVMGWLLGSVENRGWSDVLWVGLPLALAGVCAVAASPGLRMLTLGEEVAATSGLPLRRMRVLAIAAASLAAGGAVAVAGVIGFVGLAAPHLVRMAVRGDPGRVLAPSAMVGAIMLALADLAARRIPTDQELKLGVFTALVGAPLFALVVWRAAREWRT